MTTPRMLHPVTPFVALIVLALGILVVGNWDRYLADSMCWSAIGFLLGYFVCRLEVQIRLVLKERRDHS